MTPQRKRILLMIAGVAAFLVIAMLLPRGPRNREPFLAEATMSDGKHRLRLLKLVEGPLEYDWKDPTPPILRRFLPPPIAPPSVPFSRVKLDGIPPGQQAIGTIPRIAGGACFLFRIVNEKGEYVVGPPFSPVVTFDESTGHEFKQPFFNLEHARWGVLSGCRAAVPRRDRTLKIKVFESHASTTPLVFEVDNPFYRPPAKEWTPAELPAQASDDAVAVTLNSFEVRDPGFIDADIRITGKGYSAAHTSFWLEDATGNRGDQISPFEPAWKLHIPITAYNIAAVAPEAIQPLGEVAIPPPGQEVVINRRMELAGVVIKMLDVHGGETGTGDEDLPSDRGESPNSPGGFRRDWPRLRIHATGPHADYDVVYRLTSNGAILNPIGSTSIQGTERDLTLVFKRPTENSPLKVEVAVARRHAVEFFVSPKDVKRPLNR